MSFNSIIQGLGGMGQMASMAAPIVQGLFGANEVFNKRDPFDVYPGLQQALNAAEASRVYSAAAANPDDPRFKNLAALEEADMRRNLIAGINEMMMGNRRAQAKGAVGFGINPERADEARASALIRAFEQAGTKARDVSRNTLLNAAQGSANAAGAYQSTYGPFSAIEDLNQTRKGIGVGGIADALGAIFGGGGAAPGGIAWNAPPAGQIIWDTPRQATPSIQR